MAHTPKGATPMRASLLLVLLAGLAGAQPATAATPVAQPDISVNDVVVGESDGHAGLVVSLNAPGLNPVTVRYVEANDTARYSSDYTYQAGTLTFAPGETSKTVPIQILD